MKQTAQNGMIAKAAEKQSQAVTAAAGKPSTLKDLLELRKAEIAKVLPSVLPAEQFLRLTLNALQNTKHLAECTMSSFYGAVMNCAQLGLKPNVNGEGFLLPFKNNKKGGIYECQFVPGYKGLMTLARRSGEIASIDAQTVYENDTFELSYGFEPTLIHKPLLSGDRGAVKGFYAAVILKDGGKNAFYMSVEDAKKYGAKYSKSYNSGPWQDNFEEMAKKSCLRQVLKYCPCSTDVETALAAESKADSDYGDGFYSNFTEVDEDEAESAVTAENTPVEATKGEAEQQSIVVDEDGVVTEE